MTLLALALAAASLAALSRGSDTRCSDMVPELRRRECTSSGNSWRSGGRAAILSLSVSTYPGIPSKDYLGIPSTVDTTGMGIIFFSMAQRADGLCLGPWACHNECAAQGMLVSVWV